MKSKTNLWSLYKKDVDPSLFKELSKNYNSVSAQPELEFNKSAMLSAINSIDSNIGNCTGLEWLTSVHGVGPHIDSKHVEYTHLYLVNPAPWFRVYTLEDPTTNSLIDLEKYPIPNLKEVGDMITIRTDKYHWLLPTIPNATVLKKVWAALAFSTSEPIEKDKLEKIFSHVVEKLHEKYTTENENL